MSKIPPRVKDIRGRVYNRLFVKDFVECNAYQQAAWLCKCLCGSPKDVIVTTNALSTGNTTSCGCQRRDNALANCLKNVKHAHFVGVDHKSLTGTTYDAMIARCYHEYSDGWEDYGSRGIKVCERWRGEMGYQNFVEDMGKRPSKRYSIDRINNDGNYEPSNCRWAIKKTQNRNKSDNVLLEYDGRTMCLSEWAEETGIRWKTIEGRLKRGWPVEKALTTPKMR